MKFLTLELYNEWYRGDPPYANDAAVNDAYKRYLKHIEQLEELSESLRELAKLRGTDDGLLVRVNFDRKRRALELILRCGDLQMGYYDLILRYEEGEISEEDEHALAFVAHVTETQYVHRSDLYFHELDLTEDERIEHRFLFHPGIEFAIRCRALAWEKIDRPNRRLPRYKERFPGGPPVDPNDERFDLRSFIPI